MLRPIPEDDGSDEFSPAEGCTDETELWFDIGKPPAREPWYPRDRTSGLVWFVSQRSSGLHQNSKMVKILVIVPNKTIMYNQNVKNSR